MLVASLFSWLAGDHLLLLSDFGALRGNAYKMCVMTVAMVWR
jgi:hypothetical protein